MTDDDILLASAYLDDDLDPDERARAEADPTVMAEVERLRAVQAQLRDVEPPTADRRERAIDAALAAFAGESAPIAPPVPLRRRPRPGWWGAAAAAAAVVVVIAGAAALRSPSEGDDVASDLATAAATEAPSDRSLATQDATEAASETAAAGDAAAGDEVAEATTAETAAAAEGTTVAAPSAVLAAPELRTPADLSAFARDADRTAVGGGAGPPACEQAGDYLGSATYDGRAVEVFATDLLVTAVDAGTCETLLSVSR